MFYLTIAHTAWSAYRFHLTTSVSLAFSLSLLLLFVLYFPQPHSDNHAVRSGLITPTRKKLHINSHRKSAFRDNKSKVNMTFQENYALKCNVNSLWKRSKKEVRKWVKSHRNYCTKSLNNDNRDNFLFTFPQAFPSLNPTVHGAFSSCFSSLEYNPNNLQRSSTTHSHFLKWKEQ